MNDLTVLHLSDLHISDGVKYSALLKRTLDDIKEQLENDSIDKIVLVVTGDIINEGNEKAVSNAKRFFRDLKSIIAEKVVSCYVVPGNHDKKRTKLNELLIPAYRSYFENKVSYAATSTGYKGTRFAKPWISNENDYRTQMGILWEIQKRTYDESGYFDLIKDICDNVFSEISDNNKRVLYDTYGVDTITIKGKRYCFVSINTAWSCIDDNDIRHIILGEFQTDEIVSQYQELTSESPANVVIALGHHPINCLYGAEQDHLFDKMISINGMKVNTYLCGHTHDRNIINWSNTSHTMYTLMTGIGWPDTATSDNQNHYYSLYTYNIDVNSLDVVVRSTRTEAECFNYDLSLYFKGTEQIDKVSRPLFYKEYPGEVPISVANGASHKSLFATSPFMRWGPRFLKAVRAIDSEVVRILNTDFDALLREEFYYKKRGLAKGDLTIEKLDYMSLDEYMSVQSKLDENDIMSSDTEEKIKEINGIFQVPNNKGEILKNLDGFFQRLCQVMRDVFTPDPNESDRIIRFHFRYLADKNSYLFSELCSSFSSGEDERKEYFRAKDMKYGDLLEAAFNCQERKCLIYSANRHLCQNKLSERWSNFITIIPRFERNRYHKKVNRTSEKTMPKITFGVTISDPRDDLLLFCLDYYRMDEMLGEIIEKYLQVFHIDIDEFLASLKHETKE